MDIGKPEACRDASPQPKNVGHDLQSRRVTHRDDGAIGAIDDIDVHVRLQQRPHDPEHPAERLTIKGRETMDQHRIQIRLVLPPRHIVGQPIGHGPTKEEPTPTPPQLLISGQSKAELGESRIEEWVARPDAVPNHFAISDLQIVWIDAGHGVVPPVLLSRSSRRPRHCAALVFEPLTQRKAFCK